MRVVIPTAYEAALLRHALAQPQHPIPPITDPMGRHWQQPPRERVLVDDTHAVMSAADFKQLLEYSTTYPGGVYPGKMWRGEIADWNTGRPVWTGRWMLRWFGIVPGKPTVCSNNQREILIA